MFKPQKALTVKESRALSGKDVKTLRKKVETQFNIEESVLNSLFPPKAEVTLLKLSNRSNAWAVAGQPLFFDLDGRGSGPVLPTVYFLWAAVRVSSPSSSSPSSSSVPLLPEVFTFSEVSPKVLGGADLFLQGFLPEKSGPPPGLRAGDLAVVRIEGNPFPFALGTMEVSSAEAVAGGMKGKGLKLLHHAFDALWALGNKSTPGPEFTPARVFPLAAAAGAASGKGGGGGSEEGEARSASAPAVPAAAQPGKQGEKEVERAAAGVAALGLSSPPPPPPPSTCDGVGGVGVAPTDASSSPGSSFFPADLNLASTAGQDAIAEFCLLAACAAVDASTLPMLTSDFQKEMTRRKPAEAPPLDLKKTSFKQLSKLLKKYEKLGVLATKVLRKQDMVASVDPAHALVVTFLEKGGGGGVRNGIGSGGSSGVGAGENPSTAEEEAKLSSSSSSSSSSSPSVPPITVELAFRVPPSLRPVFAAPGGPPAPQDDFYSEAEVRRALSSYLASEKLVSSDENPISAASVDRLLLAALFNKGSDRELAEGEGKTLPVSALEERLLSRLTKYTRVRRSVVAAAAPGSSSPSSPPTTSFEEKVFRGPLKKISIAVEDRQGGRKHVTRVSGVERFALSPDALASTLQRKFKTSASVSRVSAEEEEVALQGDAARQLVLFFGTEYGIGAAHIEVKTKGGGGR